MEGRRRAGRKRRQERRRERERDGRISGCGVCKVFRRFLAVALASRVFSLRENHASFLRFTLGRESDMAICNSTRGFARV